jgi:hypothetical protein
MRASVLIDFKTAGTAEAKRAVEGIVQATRKAANDTAKARAEEKAKAKEGERALRRLAAVISETAKAKAKVEKDAAKAVLTAQKQADREATASAKAAARTQADEAKRRAREEINAYRTMHRIRREQARETGRLERQEAAQARATARQAIQGRRNMRRGMMQLGAGAMALGFTGVDQVRNFGSTLGVRSREEMVQRSMGFERGLIRLAGQANLSTAQQAATREKILDISGRTQVDPMDMLETATMAQNRFSDFSFFEQNAERFAQASNALDVPMQDIAGAVGEFRRQMGVTSAEIPELIGAMTAAAQRGSIEFSDVSAEFASAIGTYSRVTGQTGMQGAREFLAGAEVLGAGGQTGSQSAVLMQNLLAKLASADVQREMRQRGIVTQRNGQFVGLNDLVQQLATNRRTDSATELQSVLGRDMQANQAMGILISESRKAAAEGRQSPLLEIAGASAAEGNAVIDRTNAALLDSTSGRARQVGVNAEIEFMRNGDALIQSMTRMAGPLAELENRFPRLAQGLETFQTSLTNLLAVFAGLRLAGGGAVLASTVNAGTAMGGAGLAAGGTGVAAGGAMSPLLPIAAIAATAYGVYDMARSGGERSFITDQMDLSHDERRAEAARISRAQGAAGEHRRVIGDASNFTGRYDSGETGRMIERLENARRALNTPGGGEALASVMQKIRDIGADDEIRNRFIGGDAGRETWARAEAQVAADRAAVVEQTVALTRTLERGFQQNANAIQGIQAAPATGSTTEPTR